MASKKSFEGYLNASFDGAEFSTVEGIYVYIEFIC